MYVERRDVLARSLSRARFPFVLPNFRRVLISRDWWGKASLFPRFHTYDSFRATGKITPPFLRLIARGAVKSSLRLRSL